MCATGQPGNDFLSDVGLVVAVEGEVVAEEEEEEEEEKGEEDGRQLVGLMSEVRLSCGGGQEQESGDRGKLALKHI